MFVLMTPAKVKAALAANMRERRLAINLTQAGLSKRSGVTLGTLRRFEQSGEISIDNLLKLMLVVGGLRKIVDASAPDRRQYSSMDEVLSSQSRPKRRYGSSS